MVRSQVHNSVRTDLSGSVLSTIDTCLYVVRSQVHNSCLSGATCLYVVRSQVHNSVSEWSDMSICGPFSHYCV